MPQVGEIGSALVCGDGFGESGASGEWQKAWRLAADRPEPFHAAPFRRPDCSHARGGIGASASCSGAQDAAPFGRTRRDDFALGGRDRGARDRASAWRLAQDGAPLARSLVGRPDGSASRVATGGCAALGPPATFTPEQVCAIMALACELPENSDLPLRGCLETQGWLLNFGKSMESEEKFISSWSLRCGRLRPGRGMTATICVMAAI